MLKTAYVSLWYLQQLKSSVHQKIDSYLCIPRAAELSGCALKRVMLGVIFCLCLMVVHPPCILLQDVGLSESKNSK